MARIPPDMFDEPNTQANVNAWVLQDALLQKQIDRANRTTWISIGVLLLAVTNSVYMAGRYIGWW